MESYGFISVLPVLTILVIAVSTKRTLFAMVCGLSVGALILAGGVTGFVGSWFNYLYVSMANETLQWLVLVIAMFGMLIMLFERSHAVQDFGYWAGKYIHTKRQALLGTVVLGIIVFLDDYLNNLAVGTTMKGITDRLKIPRTQLAYAVNSVAAPVCVLVPLSSWAVYFGALLENEGIVGSDGTGISAYISAIPIVFYGWLAVLVVILQVLGIIPKLGSIKRDTERAELTGEVFPEGTDLSLIQSASDYELPEGKKAQPWAFLIPLAVMIAVTLYCGSDVLTGALAGVVSAAVLYGIQRRLSFKELLTCCYDGVLSMGFVLILSVLAFAVQSANTDLMLADYVISVTQPIMHGAFLPAAVFLVCAVYAYTTGCFWDLAAIITPIVVPLASAMGVDPLLACAAVFSGAAFGSNTCLYGDGVILCSQGCQIKPIELMMATLPYALIAGGGSLILYLIAGFVM
jgi:Na+/H+ antiporter NhaC